MKSVEELSFYPKIKAYYEKGLVKVIEVPEKTFLTGAVGDRYAMHYILEGRVKVYGFSHKGRSLLLDDISEGRFCGYLTKVIGHKFEPQLQTRTRCKLLTIPERVLNELLMDGEFAAFFYKSSVDSVYRTYHKLLLRDLFSQKEIVGFYIWQHANGNIFNVPLLDVEEDLIISRRSLFYVMKQLKDDGIIIPEKNSYYISDKHKLEDVIENIRLFKETLQ